ncbi:MAG: hypothetical protein NC082_03440 [Clostridiales bacterium]|nr:hypothetical protein [Clostridiales bacterium]
MKHIYPIQLTKLHATLVAAVMLCAVAGGCRDTYSASDNITTAEHAINIKDYDLARSICETFNTDSTTALTINDLCRLSIIYMKLSDVENTEINTATATQCYRSAMKADSDSATLYYDNLPIDEARHVEIMSQIDRILNGATNRYIDEDSIKNDYFTDENIDIYEE